MIRENQNYQRNLISSMQVLNTFSRLSDFSEGKDLGYVSYFC